MNVQAIAERYHAAKHEPNHPSYRAFCIETLAQWETLQAQGYAIETTEHNRLYQDSSHMFWDIARKHLYVYSGGNKFAPKHPLRAPTGFLGLRNGARVGELSINEVFRAVHDINGHYRARSPYETFSGELGAYRVHSAMYSDAAQLALYSETIAQLCIFYHTGQFVSVQKCAILPIEL